MFFLQLKLKYMFSNYAYWVSVTTVTTFQIGSPAMDLVKCCIKFTNLAASVGTDFYFCSFSGWECSDNICASSFLG